MSLRYRIDELAWRLRSAGSDARRGLRLAWYRADKEACAFALMIGVALAAFGFGLHSVFERHQRTQELAREAERQNLACLARNVYYEARGEPPRGQYAVAEVTMNRLASARYPNSVCAVVHEKRWDTIRKRYVGAFSWTELELLQPPAGEEWKRALSIAADVYHRRVPPSVDGATYYHAITIKPSWAREQERVARIGRHVFYR